MDQLKYDVRHLNIYTSEPSNIVNLIRKVFKENISTENWVNCTNIMIKEERFRVGPYT